MVMTTEVQKIKHDGDAYENIIVPPVDIYETENEYVIKADMPGVKKENIKITMNNNELEIHGETKTSEEEGKIHYREFTLNNFLRTFNTGNDIDSSKIEATLEHGVLTLILPKKEEVKPRKIEISSE